MAHYRAVAKRGLPALDGALFVGAVSVALVAYSFTIHLVPAYTALYVPLNLGATAVLLAVARRAGLGRGDLGLRPGALGRGVRWGGAIALAAAVGLGVALAVPALHPLLEDERVGNIGYGLLAYRTLIRIPLGTVVLEEVAFRGVLFGAWARLEGPRRAAIGSSVVFGIWHIRPALDLLRTNDFAQSTPAQIPAVALAVVLTAGAGVLFCVLRIRSGSLVAPALAHAAINSLATVAAFVVVNG